jgi:hypothetical protein
MVIDQLGKSFLPIGRRGDCATDDPTARLESAFKRMALRLPRVLGARAIAPEELLRSRGAAGDAIGDADVLREIIDRINRGMIATNDMLSGGETNPVEELLPGFDVAGRDATPPRFQPVDDATGNVTIAEGDRQIPIDPAPLATFDPPPRRVRRRGRWMFRGSGPTFGGVGAQPIFDVPALPDSFDTF